MTQFMLVIGESPKHILDDLDISSCPIHRANSFLKNTSDYLFAPEQIELCWYPDSDRYRETVHDLFNEAYNDISCGQKNLTETVIGKLLLGILPMCEEIIIWYSHDFQDLCSVNDPQEFINIINNEIQAGLGEIYLRFKR